MLYIPPEIEKEEEKLIKEYLDSDMAVDIHEFVKKHASKQYLKWSKETDIFIEEEKAKGFLV